MESPCYAEIEKVETLLLERNIRSTALFDDRISSLALKILQGRYLEVITSNNALSPINFVNKALTVEAISSELISYVESAMDHEDRSFRTLECLMIGISYLDLYSQVNYTGPEIAEAEISPLQPMSATARSFDTDALEQLECDGNYAFPTCILPQSLLFARIILSTLAEPKSSRWRDGIRLSADGVVSRPPADSVSESFVSIVSGLQSAVFWSARATVIHARLIQNRGYEEIPTLWRECQDLFSRAIHNYGNRAIPDLIAAQVWLEWGLCCHHFSFGDKGKASFRKAQEAAGLDVTLTAALGKRSKYQRQDIAQLLVATSSSLVVTQPQTATQTPIDKVNANANVKANVNVVDATEGEGILPPLPPKETPVAAVVADKGEDVTSTNTDTGVLSSSEGGWQHSEWELGRRVVREAEGGEEAALREVLLDSMDGGAAENILIEGGPKFADEDTYLKSREQVHIVDQAILLSLCLDVKNSNPEDGLTNEEMLPYVERVLNCSQNWMVHSTALLQRSWLEFERRRTADRAMLQIQALLDQHTTRLTFTQSTKRCIEEAAPAQERISFIHSLTYPSQYELKRDLAERYLKCQVFQSALQLFRELEMWDEVVTCYQLLSKPHRAELVVRERLKCGESPYMLNALGDLTSDESYYERAWTLSKRRYARAKRTLARICYDRGEWSKCISHLEEALQVQPLVSPSWYLQGLAAMHLEEWDVALIAFTRCVQQMDEPAEPWTNIGAIHMRRGEHRLAIGPLTEALKQQPDNWRIRENMVTACLSVGSLREATIHLEHLLSLRHKSGQDLYIPEMRQLVRAIADDPSLSALRQRKDGGVLTASECPPLVRSVGTLLEHCCVAVPGNVQLWDLCAVWALVLGDHSRERDCRVKQFRAAVAVTGWEKTDEGLQTVVTAAVELVKTHVPGASKQELYACKAMLATAVRKADHYWEGKDHEQVQKLSQQIAEVESAYLNM